MKIRVLGCHGSDLVLDGKGPTRQCRPCAFLINNHVLLDAGTIGSLLTLDEQKQITHVLLSHVHFDHIKDLPLLADNLVGESRAPLVIAALPETLNGVHAHIFNSTIYPDFFRIPIARPVLVAHALQPDQEWSIAELRIVPIKVNHLVPTVGFLISDEDTTILYSGDTYQTDEIWNVAAVMPNLSAAFIEVSYPNHEAALARQAKHLTPQLFGGEFRKLRRPDLPVYAYHLKPRFRTQIELERQELHCANVSVLEEDLEFTF